jgi:hypothetical protein
VQGSRNFSGGRGTGHGQGGGGGYDRRIRPNAQKNLEKYLNLAKDALADGEIIQAENWFQHADHYQRVLNACDEQERAIAATRPAESESYEQQPRGGYDDETSSYAPQGGERQERSDRDRPDRERPDRDRPERQSQRSQSQSFSDSDGEDGPRAPAAQPQPQRQQPRMRPQHPQPRRRPAAEEEEQGLNVPFLMNAPQPVIRAPAAVTPPAVPAAVVTEAEAGADTPAAPRRRGRPRKNPDGVVASV